MFGRRRQTFKIEDGREMMTETMDAKGLAENRLTLDIIDWE